MKTMFFSSMKRECVMLRFCQFAICALLICLSSSSVFAQDENESALTLVVMDPLCDRLACDCVEGYAQRKYEALGEYLQKQTQLKVEVFWGESIQAALEETDRTPDLIIGKHSVVQHNSRAVNAKVKPVAQLTGKDGSVMQTGLIVVRRDDPATAVADLEGYRIFFGPEDCDEKSKAPMELLKSNGIALPEELEVSGACSQAATKLVELDKEIMAAAVISSYAEPLLAGCGTIQKGDLRVIGVSDEVPFVTAFLNTELPADVQKSIVVALLESGDDETLVKALETESGFVPFAESEDGVDPAETKTSGSKKK